MLPVPNFQTAKDRWDDLRAAGIRVAGFLLFDGHHKAMVSYMYNNGLKTLDKLLSPGGKWRCGLFVIDPPTPEWESYVQQVQHPWWQVFRANTPPPGPVVDTAPVPGPRAGTPAGVTEVALALIKSMHDVVVQTDRQATDWLPSFYMPVWYEHFDRTDVIKITQSLGVAPERMPCVVVCRSPKDRDALLFTPSLTDKETVAEVTAYLAATLSGDVFAKTLDTLDPPGHKGK